MLNNAFCQPISVDTAPEGHFCDMCNKLAVHHLTAIGGVHHNQAGYFCQGCGEDFANAVELTLSNLPYGNPLREESTDMSHPRF